VAFHIGEERDCFSIKAQKVSIKRDFVSIKAQKVSIKRALDSINLLSYKNELNVGVIFVPIRCFLKASMNHFGQQMFSVRKQSDSNKCFLCESNNYI